MVSAGDGRYHCRAKMFNPLFTTRDTGRNTGLGLSLAYDVVREHGGDIHAESEPRRYTEIKVLLPKAPRHTGRGGLSGIPEPTGERCDLRLVLWLKANWVNAKFVRALPVHSLLWLRYAPSTSMTQSQMTAVLLGRTAMPGAERACCPRSP